MKKNKIYSYTTGAEMPHFCRQKSNRLSQVLSQNFRFWRSALWPFALRITPTKKQGFTCHFTRMHYADQQQGLTDIATNHMAYRRVRFRHFSSKKSAVYRILLQRPSTRQNEHLCFVTALVDLSTCKLCLNASLFKHFKFKYYAA